MNPFESPAALLWTLGCVALALGFRHLQAEL